MPGLFALNERAVISGRWEHGYFSLTAVGAYNVGSIQLTIDQVAPPPPHPMEAKHCGYSPVTCYDSCHSSVSQDLCTNQKGRYKMGEYSEKTLGGEECGLELKKGDKVGCFSMGSSVVLIFEAPRNFQFVVEPGQQVLYGQPLGGIRPS